MDGPSRAPTATVFVGNIPYDVTEQMLMDMFGQAGPIKSLRLVTDKDSGKPKGYGFCEYHDVQTAQSAVRNLNKFEVNGRMLRVDFADEHDTGPRGKRPDKPDLRGPRDRPGGDPQSLVPAPPPGTRPVGREASMAGAQQANALLGNAPYTGPGQDRICAVIAGMTPMQLYEILAQMRTLCGQNPTAARGILVANPQLCKALFQAQVLLGVVKGSPPPSSLGLGPQGAMPPAPQPGPGPGPPPQQPPPMHGMPPAGPPPPVQGPGSLPYGMPPGPGPVPYGGGAGPGPQQPPPMQPPQPVPMVGGLPVVGQLLIDPNTGMPYNAPPGAVLVPAGQPPPAQPPPAQPMMGQAPPPPMVQPPGPMGPAPDGGVGGAPPAAVPVPSSLAPQQAQVLQQVLSLTQAQIDALPPAQRQQVMLVRQQMGLPPQ